MAFEIIQQNFIGATTALFLILFIITNNNFEKKINRLFLAAATCVLLLIIEEAWEFQLAKQPTYAPLRVPLSAFGYMLRPMIPYFLTLTIKNYTKKWTFLMSIPLIFNLLVAGSALFCKLAFWYTPYNEFVRGPLGITPFVIAGFYIVVLLILTLLMCRKGDLTEAVIVSAIVLLAFTSTIMESLFQFRGIQNASIGTSITFYYLFFHSNRCNRDTLTGALVRRRFYLDAEKYHSSLSAIISLDLNDLKKLNDQYGHIEGDKALISVSDIIKRNTGVRASLYRIGGDEFMILCYKFKEEKVQDLINRIYVDLQKTQYRCAIGYALYSPHMNLERVCQLADQAMYEKKRQMKETMEKPVLSN